MSSNPNVNYLQSHEQVKIDEIRESEDYTAAVKYIKDGTNGYDFTQSNPEAIQAAWWDLLEEFSDNDEARLRVSEITRATRNDQRDTSRLNILAKKLGSTGTSWMSRASCGSADPDLFFSGAPEALDYCVKCPVAEECLEFAISSNIMWGIWGGVTESARRKLIRRRRRDMALKRNQ